MYAEYPAVPVSHKLLSRNRRDTPPKSMRTTASPAFFLNVLSGLADVTTKKSEVGMFLKKFSNSGPLA
jgi:hypothetical protein